MGWLENLTPLQAAGLASVVTAIFVGLGVLMDKLRNRRGDIFKNKQRTYQNEIGVLHGVMSKQESRIDKLEVDNGKLRDDLTACQTDHTEQKVLNRQLVRDNRRCTKRIARLEKQLGVSEEVGDDGADSTD